MAYGYGLGYGGYGYGDYGYGDYGPGDYAAPYGYDDEGGAPPPQYQGQDQYQGHYNAQQRGGQCGGWAWNATQSRYVWVAGGC